MKDSDKTAVYWGTEPYPKGHEGFAPYQGWEQAHASDLGEADYTRLLKSARDWLAENVLKDAVEGIVPDTKFRAALDLAIRTCADGKYSVGLHPAVYNQLLARLAGVPTKGTLETIRASESVYPSRRERTTMSASAQIRQFASKYASTNPEVSYDLLDLASRVAQEEEQGQQGQQQGQQQAQQKQGGELPPALKEHMEKKEKEGDDEDQGQQKQAYSRLKSACLTAAKENPNARAVFLPILKTIKQLG